MPLRWAIALVAVVVTLVGLEGVTRVFAAVTGRERGVAFHPVLGWKPLPSVSKFGEFWGQKKPATTNSRGWRDKERAFQKSPGMVRAVAIGDSFTAGVPVDDGERFTDLLETSVSRLEVLNMGVVGFGTDQELLALEEEGFAYQPDFVILTTFLGNDLGDIRSERRNSWPKPVFLLNGNDLILQPPRMTFSVYVRTKSYLGEMAFRAFRPEIEARLSPAWENADPVPLFEKILERLKQACTKHNAKLIAILAYDPDRIGKPPLDIEQRVIAAFASLDIPRIDTREAFDAFPAHGASLYAADGTHWNVSGHQVVHEALRKKLMAMAWIAGE